jgi:Domain of unknown function (DUF5671)
MPVIRRLYLYTIAFVALGMLLIGSVQLLQVLLEIAAESFSGGAAAVGPSLVRQRLSLSIALALIGLVGWTTHWWLARRSLLHGAEGALERRSTIRHLYLYGVLLIGGILGLGAASGLVHDLLRALLGESTRSAVMSGAIVDPAALLLVTGALWTYHVRVTATDRAHQPEAGKRATLRRWFIYSLTFYSLFALVLALGSLTETLWSMGTGFLPGAPIPVADTGLFAAKVLSSGAAALAALVVWLVAWQWSRTWLTRPGDADPESASVLRKVFLYLVLGGAIAFTTWAAGFTLHQVLRVLLVPERAGLGSTEMIRGVGPALAIVVVFGITWAYHAHVLGQELALTREAQRQSIIRWFYSYLVAVIGLAAVAIGLAGTTATLLDLAIQPLAAHPLGWWQDQISLFATLAAIGLPIWLAYWLPLQREAADLTARRSVVRRIYVFLVFGAMVLTLLFSGVVTLYQVVRLALGETWTSGQTTDTVIALSALAVAALLLVYHLGLLRAEPGEREVPPAAIHTLAITARSADTAQLVAFRRAVLAQAAPGLELEVEGLGPGRPSGESEGPGATASRRADMASAHVA